MMQHGFTENKCYTVIFFLKKKLLHYYIYTLCRTVAGDFDKHVLNVHKENPASGQQFVIAQSDFPSSVCTYSTWRSRMQCGDRLIRQINCAAKHQEMVV